jgi:hypothetical protein
MSKYENVTKKLINFGKGYDIVTWFRHIFWHTKFYLAVY